MVATAFFILFSQLTLAKDGPGTSTCPVNLALGQEEHNAFISFNARLSHLQRYYGTPMFMTELNEILATEWPEDRVIDISATFMERVLNRVEQEYLKDSIAASLGLDNQHWWEFERVMRNVTLFGRLSGNKHGAFTRKTLALMEAIKRTPAKYFRTQGLNAEEREVYKARAISRLANMVLYIERWSEINREIAKLRAEASGRQLMIGTLGLTSAGILVASLVYAGPIVTGAGAFAGKFAADTIVATQLIRLGQAASGALLGGVGGPITLLLADSTTTILQAQRMSADNGTVYVCELDRQIQEWRERGVGPYLGVAALGAGSGMLGGVLTFHKVGAQVVLHATSFGVAVMNLYSLGQLHDNSMRSLAEYKLAQIEMERGNRPKAKEHLRNSRAYAQRSGERLLESIIVTALSASIGAGFKAALFEGEAAIRILFANSSDTLPLAAGVAIEAISDLKTDLK